MKYQINWSADIEDGDEDIHRGHLKMEPFTVETPNTDIAFHLVSQFLNFAVAVGYENDRVSNRIINSVTDETGKVIYPVKKEGAQND